LTDYSLVNRNWKSTDYADQFFQRERQFLQAALRQAASPKALQIGNLIDTDVVADLDLPFLVHADNELVSEAPDLLADAAFLPFAPESFSTVILPHALEGHSLPHQVLREVHRVLMPDGHLVLTGFNPYSLMGLQNLVHKKAVYSGRYYSSPRVIDWLQLLGFQVVASSMCQYAPLLKSERLQKMFGFLESVGDRWLPMTGGAYMITAKKRDVGMTLVGRVKFRNPKPKLINVGASSKSSKHATREIGK